MADKVIAIVPVRGGSKGIKKKNIRDVCGKPLIYYQLMNGLNAKRVSHVVLATDDADIARLGKEITDNRIKVIMRPPEISHDLSKTEETLLYVLKQLGETDFDVVVTLEPTNPLNRPEYVDRCISKVLDDGCDTACCVMDDYGFFLDTEKEIKRLIKRPMRRDIKAKVRETGNCWVTKCKTLFQTNNRLGGRIGFVKIPRHDGYHIDDESDWRIVESLLKQKACLEQDKYFKVRKPIDKTAANYEKGYWVGATDPDGIVRNRLEEREKRLRECTEEISYINRLNPGRILDVGCGPGFLLSGVNNKWEKYGVEVSLFAAKHAKKYGKIVCGTLRYANYKPDYFDVVVLYHVIEHMADPLRELEEVRRILRPGGKLIAGTPDFECSLAKRFGDNFRLLRDKTHVSLFSAIGLFRMLTDLLFEIERVSYPFFDTEHFTKENLLRLFDTSKASPPFYGNIMTFYAYKK